MRAVMAISTLGRLRSHPSIKTSLRTRCPGHRLIFGRRPSGVAGNGHPVSNVTIHKLLRGQVIGTNTLFRINSNLTSSLHRTGQIHSRTH